MQIFISTSEDQCLELIHAGFELRPFTVSTMRYSTLFPLTPEILKIIFGQIHEFKLNSYFSQCFGINLILAVYIEINDKSYPLYIYNTHRENHRETEEAQNLTLKDQIFENVSILIEQSNKLLPYKKLGTKVHFVNIEQTYELLSAYKELHNLISSKIPDLFQVSKNPKIQDHILLLIESFHTLPSQSLDPAKLNRLNTLIEMFNEKCDVFKK
jgi:hypothetical protein